MLLGKEESSVNEEVGESRSRTPSFQWGIMLTKKKGA